MLGYIRLQIVTKGNKNLPKRENKAGGMLSTVKLFKSDEGDGGRESEGQRIYHMVITSYAKGKVYMDQYFYPPATGS